MSFDALRAKTSPPLGTRAPGNLAAVVGCHEPDTTIFNGESISNDFGDEVIVKPATLLCMSSNGLHGLPMALKSLAEWPTFFVANAMATGGLSSTPRDKPCRDIGRRRRNAPEPRPRDTRLSTVSCTIARGIYS